VPTASAIVPCLKSPLNLTEGYHDTIEGNGLSGNRRYAPSHRTKSSKRPPNCASWANSRPKPNDAFVELHDFVFGDGETLASLKLHYLTLGTARRHASGAIANGVLLLHGTAGSAADLAQAPFFDALYGAGQPLDLSRYLLVIPDAIGAGDSSKPSGMTVGTPPATASPGKPMASSRAGTRSAPGGV
jgi:hypothetical protein